MDPARSRFRLRAATGRFRGDLGRRERCAERCTKMSGPRRFRRRCRCAGRLGVVTDRLGWQRVAVSVTVLGVVAASLITGELWRVGGGGGGASSGKSLRRYGPHW